MERVYTAPADRDELLFRARQSGGTWDRTVHVVGPRVSSDGIGFDREDVGYDEEGVETKVSYHYWRRCDCGAALGQNTHLLGTCGVCGRVVCTAEGCGKRCERCGVLVCAGHAVTYSGHSFCSRHRVFAWWLLFWGMLR